MVVKWMEDEKLLQKMTGMSSLEFCVEIQLEGLYDYDLHRDFLCWWSPV